MPGHDRVGSDDRSDFTQELETNRLALHGQTPSLVIGQSEPLSSKLLLQDTILLLKVFDDVLLVPIDPASECGEEDLPGLQVAVRPVILPPVEYLDLTPATELSFTLQPSS